jgi:PAS domain S-box-containing protein
VLHHFFERSDDLLCVADLDGGLLHVNAAWERVLGWDRSTLLGTGFVDLLHPDDVTSTRAAAISLREGVGVVDFENRYRRIDGSYVWLSWRAEVDLDASVVLCTVRDISESRRRQVHLSTLEEVTRVGTWEIDVDTGRLLWSRETHRIHGTDPDTYVPRIEDGLSFYPPAARVLLEPAVQRSIDTGETYDLVLPFLTAKGRSRWVRAVGRAELRDGRPIRLYGTFQDVTEEHAARESLRHVRDLVELSEEGIVEATVGGTVLYCNPRFAQLLGTDPSLLTGGPLRPYLSDDGLERMADWARQLRDGGADVVRGEVALRRPDGEVVHVQVAATARRQDGRLTSATAVVTDVTEQVRQRAELERARTWLEASETRLQLVLEATRDGWWDIDVAAGTAFYSPRWWELHGFAVGETTISLDTWRLAIASEALPAFEARLEEVLSRREPFLTVRSTARRKDGTTFPVEVQMRLAYDADGRLVRASGVTSDITALLAAERQQEAFVSTVSHELRTPLTAIGGAIELLPRLAQLDDRAAEVVEMARRNSVRLRTLIDDLLQIDALVSGTAVFAQDAVAVDDVVAQVIHDAAPIAARRGVTIGPRSRRPAPGCSVMPHGSGRRCSTS